MNIKDKNMNNELIKAIKKANQREYTKEYYQKNKEKFKEYYDKYVEKNKKKRVEYKAKWFKANQQRLKDELTDAQRESIKAKNKRYLDKKRLEKQKSKLTNK
jgi:hypothetical protein